MKRMLSTCHMPHDEKKEPFLYVGGGSSICVPVSKGEAEHLRENLKAQSVRSTSG